jgi:uncharacterized membrane protein YoaK (UPF0700 family)
VGPWREALDTLRPSRGGKDGPLPPLLLVLTVVTGLVDATSYLKLGHVFVANMTGNVVFLGFALAGAAGVSIPASLVALAGFLIGSLAGGRLGSLRAAHRGHLLRDALALEIVLVAAALGAAAAASGNLGGGARYPVIVLLAVAMGIQNATARRLAVPDMTTTVLTLTLTGVAADSALGGGGGSRAGRRVLSVSAMLVGALIGALMVLHVGAASPLEPALALLVLTALAVHRFSREPADWAHA